MTQLSPSLIPMEQEGISGGDAASACACPPRPNRSAREDEISEALIPMEEGISAYAAADPIPSPPTHRRCLGTLASVGRWLGTPLVAAIFFFFNWLGMYVLKKSEIPRGRLATWRTNFWYYYLDKSAPHLVGRWLGTLAVVAIYVLRIYFVQSYYYITYCLVMYVLLQLFSFLTPRANLGLHRGGSLPIRASDDFKPFIRLLPEFKF